MMRIRDIIRDKIRAIMRACTVHQLISPQFAIDDYICMSNDLGEFRKCVASIEGVEL